MHTFLPNSQAIWALIDPANLCSMRLDERLGEQLEDEAQVRGHRVAAYALTRCAWRAA
jgi:RimJ/RimL family protein N-acetyltransferase